MNWGEMRNGIMNRWTISVLLISMMAMDVCQSYFTADQGSAAGSRTSYTAHIGGELGGILFGILVLRNPVLQDYEKYCIIPVAAFLCIFLSLFSISWIATQWPPEYAWYAKYMNDINDKEPCCWQVLRCGGLDEDEYEYFTCDGNDLMGGGNMMNSCDDMKDWAALCNSDGC